MSYDFLPMTEEEINRSRLVDDGVYDFNVVACERKVSRAQNPMAKLTIEFWDKEGRVHTIFDYLIFSKIGLNIRKVKHFCEAVGLQDKYLLGQIPEELEGYSGKARIITQVGKEIEEKDLNGKPPGSKYQDRNVVEDYISYDVKSSALQPLKDTKTLPMDDIPF